MWWETTTHKKTLKRGGGGRDVSTTHKNSTCEKACLLLDSGVQVAFNFIVDDICYNCSLCCVFLFSSSLLLLCCCRFAFLKLVHALNKVNRQSTTVELDGGCWYAKRLFILVCTFWWATQWKRFRTKQTTPVLVKCSWYSGSFIPLVVCHCFLDGSATAIPLY